MQADEILLFVKNKLLITKGGALGDVLVSTAAIFEITRCEEFTEIEICGPQFITEFFSPKVWNRISKIWVIDKKYKMVQEFQSNGEIWQETGKRISYWQLLHNDFNSIINLKYESLRFILPAYFAGIKTRIGSTAWYASFLYTHCAEWIGLEPIIHERDRNFQVVSTYSNLKDCQLNWKNKALPKLWENKIEVLKKYNIEGDYILINPTCSEKYKAWQAEKFTKLIEKIKDEYAKKNIQIILVGTESETLWLNEVNKNHALKVVQPKSIHDLIQIVGHAKLLITNASSMHYIASAQETPAIVLYGAAVPEIWGVLGQYSKSIHGQYPQHIQDKKIAETTAFQNLSVEKVVETVLLYSKELGIV